MNRASCCCECRVLSFLLLLLLAVVFPNALFGQASVHQGWKPNPQSSVAQNALNLKMGFNGPDSQFPYTDTFYSATEAYYQSLGRQMPGVRYCHAYLSWDIAEQPVGSGNINKEGTRNWFENWLSNAQGHCDEALITFKYISGVSTGTGFPTPATYEAAFVAFQNTSWFYTGWTGRFAFTPWNEPNNGHPSGDGLHVKLDPHIAADYYLAIRKHCLPSSCTVVAGGFGSNGHLGRGYVQNCASDSAPLCVNATYMDIYKHYLMADAPSYGLAGGMSFRPEIFAYHGWDDVNDYIHKNPNCDSISDSSCTTYVLLKSLSQDTWKFVKIWDTEVGAGQYGHTNPNAVTQACAASFLLRLTATAGQRITHIFYTKAYMSNGKYWSLFDSSGTEKPAFYVLADRNISYVPPAGDTCP